MLRVLSKVNSLPIDTKNVTKKITGGDVFKYEEPGSVGVEKTLNQLLAYGWITKDNSYAILPYIPVATLRTILEMKGWNKKGTKPELIEKIKEKVPPEVIPAYSDKEIFVITPAGKEVMEHFKHFYWAETHRYLLPYYRNSGIELDSSYFMKHPDVVPYDYLLQYYDLEPDKLSTLYAFSEKYEKAFIQKLTHVTYQLWIALEKGRVGDELKYIEIHGWDVSTGNGQSSKLNNLYNQANIANESLDNYLTTLFETLDKEQLAYRLEMPEPLAKLGYITFDQYKTIMTMMSKGDMLSLEDYLALLSADIREANGFPRDEVQRARFTSDGWMDEESYRQQFPKYEPPTVEEFVENLLCGLPGGDIYDSNEGDKIEIVCKVIETFEKDEIQQVIDYLQGFL